MRIYSNLLKKTFSHLPSFLRQVTLLKFCNSSNRPLLRSLLILTPVLILLGLFQNIAQAHDHFHVHIHDHAQEIKQENLTAAIQKTEDTVKKLIENKRMAGVAIAVVYRNQVIYMEGYGVRTMGEPEKVDVDTLFQLGSVSKPIAATLAAVLETKGYLHLDDPVTLYLPDFALNSKQPRNTLKIINVLDHTSGLTRGGFNNMIESFAPHDKLVATLQTVRVNAPVGKRYDYHNAMFSLISDIIEATTHQKFEVDLSSFLLKPLNMNRTSATLAGLLSTINRASPHSLRGGRLYPHDEYSKGYYSVAPAGGINSSVRDMANFLKAQMGGYPQVVNQQALTRMHTPYTTTNNLLAGVPGASVRIKNPSYGLGWRVVDYMGEPLVFHGGWLKGFTNFIGFMPEKQLGIVILHNADTKFCAKTAMKFFEIALGLPELAETPKSTKGKAKSKGVKKVKSAKTKKSSQAKKETPAKKVGVTKKAKSTKAKNKNKNKNK